MGDQLSHIKGAAEARIIARVVARADQAHTAARTIAVLYWTDVPG
jgi:hypothetical protein